MASASYTTKLYRLLVIEKARVCIPNDVPRSHSDATIEANILNEVQGEIALLGLSWDQTEYDNAKTWFDAFITPS